MTSSNFLQLLVFQTSSQKVNGKYDVFLDLDIWKQQRMVGQGTRSISNALSSPVYIPPREETALRVRSAGSFPEQRLVIEPRQGGWSDLWCPVPAVTTMYHYWHTTSVHSISYFHRTGKNDLKILPINQSIYLSVTHWVSQSINESVSQSTSVFICLCVI